MSFNYLDDLDDRDWKILQALEQDGRMSIKDIAARAGLSSPAVTERIKRLEEEAVILGYRAIINPPKVGLAISAVIRFDTPPDKYAAVVKTLGAMRGITSCLHVAGGDSFVINGHFASVQQLETAITVLSRFGRTTTSVVLSSALEGGRLTDVPNRERVDGASSVARRRRVT